MEGSAVCSAVSTPSRKVDAVVVGAGFGGMYMLYRLRELGFSVQVIEAGSDVGGTWYWNRYPGARCDIESMFYSYSFSPELQQEWEWSERYAAQPELLSYLQHVADRFELRSHIQFSTRVQSAVFQEDCGRWDVATDKGEVISARFCILATGSLSAANIPNIPGLKDFQGDVYHTAHWPREQVSFAGKRVGIIGTGSSGVQAIPLLAEEAEHLYVFQRTPNYCIPARNAPLTKDYVQEIKRNYPEIVRKAKASLSGVAYVEQRVPVTDLPLAERQRIYNDNWQFGGWAFGAAFPNLMTSKEQNDDATDFIRMKIREIVKDPEVAEKLCPSHYLGAKRNTLGTNYYETYNRDNVTLVDVKASPIVSISSSGVETEGGEHALDCLIFATGFDAMTGSFVKVDVRGKNGLTLKEKWSGGPKNYLGMMTAEFPNLFIMAGPGTPASLSNFVLSIEQQVEWLADCADYLRKQGLKTIEPLHEAESQWVDHVNEVASKTFFMTGNSWYLGANIPGKPRVFMPYIGGYSTFKTKCDASAAEGYSGFKLGD